IGVGQIDFALSALPFFIRISIFGPLPGQGPSRPDLDEMICVKARSEVAAQIGFNLPGWSRKHAIVPVQIAFARTLNAGQKIIFQKKIRFDGACGECRETESKKENRLIDHASTRQCVYLASV